MDRLNAEADETHRATLKELRAEAMRLRETGPDPGDLQRDRHHGRKGSSQSAILVSHWMDRFGKPVIGLRGLRLAMHCRLNGVPPSSPMEPIRKHPQTRMVDPVHGGFYMPDIAYVVMNTTAMKVLKDKKQLGNAHHLYVGGVHDRFGHSCSVGYLSMKMLISLSAAHPELEITHAMVLMVLIAGIVHDVGHGPLSHLYESSIAKGGFKHEDMSENLFRNSIMETPHVREAFDDAFEDPDHAVDVICDLIKGKGDLLPEKHRFIASIVSDSTAGMDMDRMDYTARDSQMMGLKTEFTTEEIITSARVVNGIISWPIKMATILDAFYRTRFRLFRDACRHRTVIAADWLVSSLSTWVVEYGDGGYTAPHAHADTKAFLEMDDTLIKREAHAGNLEAREILRRLDERDFPILVTEFEPAEDIDSKDLLATIKERVGSDGFAVRLDNHYGSKQVDPLTQVQFFDHAGHIVAPVKNSGLRPSKFQEIKIMVFARQRSATKAVQDALDAIEGVDCSPTYRVKHWYTGR